MENTHTIGKTYTVTTASECTVTDSNGLVLCTATAGEQKAFVATTSTISFSDESATVTEVFKGALALGGSGGSGGGSGTPGTPAGFGAVTATATSLAAGSTPTASVETSGYNTAKNFAFTFGIPQGEKGEKGDTGPTGPQGAQGANGYDLIYSPYVPYAFVSSTVHDLGELNTAVDLSAVAFAASSTSVQTCEVWLSCGETVYDVTWPSGAKWVGDAPTMEVNKAYRFALRQEPNGALLINLSYEYSA